MISLPVPCLALVTDRSRCLSGAPSEGAGQALARVVDQAMAGGVDLVQLREKDMPGGPLLALARVLREVTQGRALLLVNDRVDVALAAGADGVHLPEEGLPVEAVRAVAGHRLLIGRSVHSEEAARRAEREGADFVQVGTIFPTSSKAGIPAAGPELMARVVRAVNIPALGIGGINVDNAHRVIHAGACGVAVIGAIMDHPDPTAAATALRQVVEDAWQRHRQAVR